MEPDVASLLESRSTFASLVNSLPISLLIKDAEGRRVFANDTYLRLRGKSIEDVVGKRDHDLFPASIADQYHRDDCEVIKTGRALHSVEETIDSRGERRWIERVKSPINSDQGTVIGIQLLFWDVTDRIHAEKALRREQQLLDTLLRHIPDSIYFKDLESRFVRVSEAMAAKFGLASADQARGMTDADIFTEEHAAKARRNEVDVMRTRQPLVDRVERETWPDREDTWCLSTKMPLVDADDQVTGTFGISRDVTEITKTQAELRRARDAADQANQAKSEFLANMSHEIRTPMNAIVGISELLSRTPLAPEQADYLHLLRDSADSLLRLINDILDFSKIEARKLELESVPLAIRDLVGTTARGLSLRASEKGLQVGWNVADDVPEFLLGDPGRLKQVLVNLIGNAIKFTDSGEVCIDVRRVKDDACPEQPLAPEDEVWIRFSVQDTGIGIADDQQAAVLEAFTQADNSTTRRFGGTGLGLAITKQLVELMGGTLDLESDVGRGTTFSFAARLRISDRTPADHQVGDDGSPSRPSSIPECPPLRVLVAEDGLANQHVAVGMLQAGGHHAVVASDGREAVSRWKSEPFDVILMDMHMPVMDGIEATAQIRQAEGDAPDRIAIIALTAAAMKQDAQACLDAGMDAHLAKPINLRQLQETLSRFAPDQTTLSTMIDLPEPKNGTSGTPVRDIVDGATTMDLKKAAARMPGGLVGVRRLAEVFLGECESILKTLEGEVPSGDPVVIARSAHTLKGSADLFDAQRVHRAAMQLEAAARDGDADQLSQAWQAVREESGAMLGELRIFLDQSDPQG